MNESQKMVQHFHDETGSYVRTRPGVPPTEIYRQRFRLIEEELEEYLEAAQQGDLVEMADAIGDMLYVVYGAAVECGLNMEPIFREIHRSNMSKLPVTKNAVGKVMKPAWFSPPSLGPLIQEQNRQADARVRENDVAQKSPGPT